MILRHARRTAAQRVHPPARWGGGSTATARGAMAVGVGGLLFAPNLLPAPPPHPSPPLRGGREEIVARVCQTTCDGARGAHPTRLAALATLPFQGRDGKALR